jgi:membrane-bound lytic murein transglycosylase A
VELRRSCAAIVAKAAVLREAAPPPEAFRQICAEAARGPVPRSQAEALGLWSRYFRPWRLRRRPDGRAGFLTGYYEPVVAGSWSATAEFSEPVYGPPVDLVAIPFAQRGDGLAAGRVGESGGLEPYPGRAAIDAGALQGVAEPVCWLRDAIEVFMIQVQGSARVRLADGTEIRLVYAGRNGRPYTSIGRVLICEGRMAQADMSLDRLKQWVREAGQGEGEAGRRMMQRNQSYVFFRAEPVDRQGGPIGGHGLPLAPLRSIAVDRALWSYGQPIWVDAEIPWQGGAPSRFRRLMIAQDTGSAIVGPGRIDIFFGSGEAAGRRAGDIRHTADVAVLLPMGVAPSGRR